MKPSDRAGPIDEPSRRTGWVRGEHDWPMAVAVIAVIVILPLVPNGLWPGPRWALTLAGMLVAALILTGRGRIDRPDEAAAAAVTRLLIVLIVTAPAAAALLLHQLIKGEGITKSRPGCCWSTARCSWSTSSVPYSCTRNSTAADQPPVNTRTLRVPKSAVTAAYVPELAPPGWRPLFFDYVCVGITNAVASAQPTRCRSCPAKAAMAVQSLISSAILSLVLVRAVNTFA